MDYFCINEYSKEVQTNVTSLSMSTAKRYRTTVLLYECSYSKQFCINKYRQEVQTCSNSVSTRTA